MAYKKIKSYDMSEAELRKLWADTYCSKPVITFDGIEVRFYTNMFDDAFFESADRKARDKSILSFNRCEKMLWIREVLEDASAILKIGWDRNSKCYANDRRVALVKDNYMVIIHIYRDKKARFITAYQNDDEKNLEAVKNSPEWK